MMDAARRARLGEKWACLSCGTKFYDLGKPEPVCPSCKADPRDIPPEQDAPAKKGRKKATKKKATAKKATAKKATAKKATAKKAAAKS